MLCFRDKHTCLADAQADTNVSKLLHHFTEALCGILPLGALTEKYVCCREWQHSETWWPRLFQHHQAIQWDDYDKDYSDLPLQVSLAQSCFAYLLFHMAPTPSMATAHLPVCCAVQQPCLGDKGAASIAYNSVPCVYTLLGAGNEETCLPRSSSRR